MPHPTVGIAFTEILRGRLPGLTESSGRPAPGDGQESEMSLALAVSTHDLDQSLIGDRHTFNAAGVARAPGLSPRPLRVTRGTVQVLVKDTSEVDAREIRYQLTMKSDEGRVFFLEGRKSVHDGGAGRLWDNLTTLHATLYDGENPTFPVWSRVILRNTPADLLRELGSLRVTGARGPVARLAAVARFGRFFAGRLWETCGGIVAPAQYARADAQPRLKRSLRAPSPEIHYFNTADGAQLRFMRYRGGVKGPVLLSHGIGVSSLIFRTDTIRTNLVEFLVARGFDVWALDYRGSIELAAHNLQFTADDVAAYDYPAAVREILKLTGTSSVQAVVHCFGSVSFFMAILKGLQGVRSAVCSQVATHLKVAPITEAKCGLFIPEALEALGVPSLEAYVNGAAHWSSKLAEAAMRTYPMPEAQWCTNPVCHRITFMYSQVFEHQQLNAATHDALQEMFGATNIHAFAHLARMVRNGHIVTASGGNDYLPHIERLAIPIAFIHGGKNRCFLPRSTEITYNLLRRSNGAKLYSRTVVPGYGHADSILGKNAARDVYPAIAEHLEATA